jgi:hypothetical protein
MAGLVPAICFFERNVNKGGMDAWVMPTRDDNAVPESTSAPANWNAARPARRREFPGHMAARSATAANRAVGPILANGATLPQPNFPGASRNAIAQRDLTQP